MWLGATVSEQVWGSVQTGLTPEVASPRECVRAPALPALHDAWVSCGLALLRRVGRDSPHDLENYSGWEGSRWGEGPGISRLYGGSCLAPWFPCFSQPP